MRVNDLLYGAGCALALMFVMHLNVKVMVQKTTTFEVKATFMSTAVEQLTFACSIGYIYIYILSLN